jgi:hypothetical protein
MYANRQPARDGFIPERMLTMLYPFKKPQALAAKLVEVGLWNRVPGGYSIHQFSFWNRSKEQVEAERESTRLRVAKHRNASAEATCNGDGNAVTVTDSAPVTNGDGNSNVPDHSSASASAASTPGESKAPRERRARADLAPPDYLQPDWQPDRESVEVLAAETQSQTEVILRQRPGFVDFFTRGKGKRRKADGWRQSWMHWVRTSAADGKLHLLPTNGSGGPRPVGPAVFDPMTNQSGSL